MARKGLRPVRKTSPPRGSSRSLTSDTERGNPRSLPTITLQPLFHWNETVEDRVFWKHYTEHLSTVLTINGEHKNVFRDMMIPIAAQHSGLMHSILSLASKHIDYDTPYGINILRNNPSTNPKKLKDRSEHHHKRARDQFFADTRPIRGDKPVMVDSTRSAAQYGQMVCFVLEALVEGGQGDVLRLHLTWYRNFTSGASAHDPAHDSEFMSFVTEFFQYHILADDLIHSALKPEACPPARHQREFPPNYSPRLLGVADGLLYHLSETTAIRNTVRSRLLAQHDFATDYLILCAAEKVDGAIQDFVPNWPPGDSRAQVTLLYQQMMSIYLSRTVRPPSLSRPSSMSSSVASLPLNSPSHARPASSVVKTPPRSASTSCASSPMLAGFGHRLITPQPSHTIQRPDVAQRHTREVGDAHSTGVRAASPAPARQPARFDPILHQQVEESLDLLEWFEPSDPCQQLLLMPCFLVGTACFKPAQQRRIRAAIKTVRAYTGFGNADSAVKVLEGVWRLMAAGDWVAAWDWPGVAERLGVDFIPA